MRTYLTALLLFPLALFAQSNVLTVSNWEERPAQYNTIQDAVDAANSGDTIYVYGSPVLYEGTLINKPNLTIIGSGYNQNNNQNFSTSFSGDLIINPISGVTNASGLNLVGLKCGIRAIANVDGTSITEGRFINDVTIMRCEISSLTIDLIAKNFAIINNIINNLTVSAGTSYPEDILVANNIINFTFSILSTFSTIPAKNFVINNNIFTKDFTLSTSTNSSGAIGFLFSNNIFYGSSPFFEKMENCIFNNNLSFGSSDDSFNLSGSNSGNNNIVSQDPKFIDAPGATDNFSFDFGNNYRLAADSPGRNYGTDGTDIGIYGGAFPFPGELTGNPPIPLIKSFNLKSTLVAPDGQLEIEVIGESNN